MSQGPKDKLAVIAFSLFFIGSFLAALLSVWPVLVLFGAGWLITYLWSYFNGNKLSEEELDKMVWLERRRERDKQLDKLRAEAEAQVALDRKKLPPEKSG